MKEENFEVVIVGGSYAGLSAALTLGRSIRRTLIIDSGMPCNAQTPHSHNFITHDGSSPALIASIARDQIRKYPTVQFLNDSVTEVTGENGRFKISTANGNMAYAKKILFATGIKDTMPDIPGFSECWGISVIHCPYCHGYEYKKMKTGILINGDMATDFAHFIHNWTDQLTIFTNGQADISPENIELLKKNHIGVVKTKIVRIDHHAGELKSLELKNGDIYQLDALYARIPFIQHCTIPKEMGCNITSEGHIEVNDFKQTSVPGIYAAGDNTTLFRAVSMAAAAGNVAGASINHELVRDKYQTQ